MKYLFFTLTIFAVSYLLASAIVEVLNKRKKRDLLTPLSFDVVTICKGVSISIIMLAHLGNVFGIRYLNPLGSLGVAVFLFASGFGLESSYNKKGLKGYWKKRITTAYLPYALIEVINCFFSISDKIQGNGFSEIIQDFLLIKPLHPYGWYMQCLFLYYIIFYIASLVSKEKFWLKCTVLLVTAIVIFVFAGTLFKQQVFSFTIGVLCGRQYKCIAMYLNKIYVCTIAFFAGGGLLLLKQTTFIRNANELIFNIVELLQVVGLMAFLIVLVHIICKYLPGFLFEIAHWIGVLSNELYLIHGLVFAVVISRKEISFGTIALFWFASFTLSIMFFSIKKFIKSMGTQNDEAK
ncbi:MAG: acyltransferase [Clostridia bacterium]|nr:acyltransferase [Clostridia bacterium]